MLVRQVATVWVSPTCRPAGRVRFWQLHDVEWLREQRAAGKAVEQLADEIGCSRTAVVNAVEGLPVTAPQHQQPARHRPGGPTHYEVPPYDFGVRSPELAFVDTAPRLPGHGALQISWSTWRVSRRLRCGARKRFGLERNTRCALRAP